LCLDVLGLELSQLLHCQCGGDARLSRITVEAGERRNWAEGGQDRGAKRSD
jgi:hypothetical protein